jgi:hypothetical protein
MANLSPSVATLVIEVLVSHAGLDDVVASSATIDDLATPDSQHRAHHLDNNIVVMRMAPKQMLLMLQRMTTRAI